MDWSRYMQLYDMQASLRRQKAEIEESLAVVTAAREGVERLLATPKGREMAGQSPLASLLAAEGVGL